MRVRGPGKLSSVISLMDSAMMMNLQLGSIGGTFLASKLI